MCGGSERLQRIESRIEEKKEDEEEENIPIEWKELIMNHDNDWSEISREKYLSEPLFEKFHDQVDWEAISEYQNLSESFIEKYHDQVDWKWISADQILRESFMKSSKIDWIGNVFLVNTKLFFPCLFTSGLLID